jgi:hypothetical protein
MLPPLDGGITHGIPSSSPHGATAASTVGDKKVRLWCGVTMQEGKSHDVTCYVVCRSLPHTRVNQRDTIDVQLSKVVTTLPEVIVGVVSQI